MTNTTVVVYPNLITFLVEHPSRFHNDIAAILHYTWRECEPDRGEGAVYQMRLMNARVRSAMVGDLYIVQNRYFFADCGGFVEISEQQFYLLQTIDDRDRLFGWEFLMTNNAVGSFIQEIV